MEESVEIDSPIQIQTVDIGVETDPMLDTEAELGEGLATIPQSELRCIATPVFFLSALGTSIDSGDDSSQSSSSHALEANSVTDISQEWFTTRDDKIALEKEGHTWRRGQWSKEEVDALEANVVEYCQNRNITDPSKVIFELSKEERKDFYRTVARGLQRPLFSVYRRVIRMYDSKNHIGKYNPQEILQLKQLRGMHGNDWAAIGKAMGRSASSVKDRCRLMKDAFNTGKWLTDEERRLSAAVYEQSGARPGENVTSGLSWSTVAMYVQTRSEKQCRTKWLNYLNWKQKGGTEWTRDDDLRLITRIGDSGATDETEIDWKVLADQWSSVRSPQWLRGKWWSLKRHVPNYNLLPFSEVIQLLKNLNTLNMRYKLDDPKDGLSDMPFLVSIQDSTADSTGEISKIRSDEEYLDLHEVFQNFKGSSGSLFITQPDGNQISLSQSAYPSDRIILHTLPQQTTNRHSNNNVMVEMNPQAHIVITDDGQQVLTLNQIASSNHQELGLVTADIGTDALDSLDSSSEIKIEDSFVEVVDEPDLECELTESSELVIPSSPQYTQTDQLMASLSDPMMVSNHADLMSSDLETDKVSHDLDD